MSWIGDIADPRNRRWEEFYRNRWQHDKVVRSTHGVNCTGGCSWMVHVKDGIITWELQATDYPRLAGDLPPYEPRGCQRGVSTPWYVYSPIRVTNPHPRGAPAGAGPDLRLPPRPRHVHAELRGGLPVPPASGRREHEFLRLVQRPPERLPGSLGGADRRRRERGLVQQQVHRGDGSEPGDDEDAGRALRARGAPQRHQAGRPLPRLQHGLEVCGLVDPRQRGAGRSLLDGGEPRAPPRGLRGAAHP